MHRALVVAVLAAACASVRGPSAVSPLVGREIQVEAPGLDGVPVAVGEDGARVRVVDVWASWCEPCRKQLPALDRLAREYAGRGVRVYGVSFDADRRELEEFLRETPVSFPVLWDAGGERLTEHLAIRRLPTTLVIDGDGVVRHVHPGYGPHHDERIEGEVRALLGE